MSAFPPSPPDLIGDRFVLEFSRDEACDLSTALSDLLCWLRGFQAARQGTDLEANEPMGVEAVRTINLQLKKAF